MQAVFLERRGSAFEHGTETPFVKLASFRTSYVNSVCSESAWHGGVGPSLELICGERVMEPRALFAFADVVSPCGVADPTRRQGSDGWRACVPSAPGRRHSPSDRAWHA
jgi:hypothetical protein